MKKPGKRTFALFGIAISVIFLWLAFRNLDPATVWQDVQQADPGWLLLGAVWYFAAVAVISWRWQFLLRAVQQVPLRGLFPLVSIGYMGNNVYPFRSGEILRIALLRRNYTVPVARGTTTVVVERVFDGLVMLTFIFVSLPFITVVAPEVRRIATVTTPLFLTALVVFFVLAAKPNLLRRLLLTMSKILPDKLGGFLENVGEDIIAGLEGLRSPAHLAGAVFASYLTWALEASVYWMVSFAFDLTANYAMMLLVVGVVNLAGLIPAAPGQLGVFEFFVSTVLISLGVADELAIAYAFVVHMVIWLPVTVVGFFFLVQQGLSLKAVTDAQQFEDNVRTSATTTG